MYCWSLATGNYAVSIVQRNLPVRMTRANLDNLPECELPEGFSIRWYQTGDEECWLRIHQAADRYNTITPDLFHRQFGTDERLLRERQCYLLNAGGHAIGTGTGWFDNDFMGAKFGRVHWMAIVPEYQGRGLATPLMAIICRRLRELGHDRAYLSTSTARLAAIHLYLRFGFVPLIGNDEETAVWRELNRCWEPSVGRTRQNLEFFSSKLGNSRNSELDISLNLVSSVLLLWIYALHQQLFAQAGGFL